MSNNVIGGRRTVLHGRQNVAIDSIGLTPDNTQVLHYIGSTPSSYNPQRQINGLTEIQIGEGYMIIAKADMDLSAYFYPPFGATNAILTEDGNPITPE